MLLASIWASMFGLRLLFTPFPPFQHGLEGSSRDYLVQFFFRVHGLFQVLIYSGARGFRLYCCGVGHSGLRSIQTRTLANPVACEDPKPSNIPECRNTA